MKLILSILLSLLSFLSFGQSSRSDSITKLKSSLVIKFIVDNLETKIGSGVCSELLIGAEEYLNKFGLGDDSMFVIDSADVRVGDIIIFDKVIFSDGSTLDNHAGIVYSIEPKGTLSYANQNVATKKRNTKKIKYQGRKVKVEKDSHVIISYLYLPSVVNGKIIFCRF